jgi:hypothetical protein
VAGFEVSTEVSIYLDAGVSLTGGQKLYLRPAQRGSVELQPTPGVAE